MEKNSSIKILNIISGSRAGGAENFFERFSLALNKYNNISQNLIIRKNSQRFLYLKKNGLIVNEFSFWGKWDFITKNKIEKIYNDFKPDIVISWMNRASSMLPKNIGNCINVGRLGGYYKIKNYLNCEYLIANTKEIRNYILEKGWDPKKVIYLPNFVEITSRKKIEKIKYKTPKNFKVILGLGRFHDNKGFDILIKAVARLPGHYLWLVGSGKLKNYYISLAQKHNLIDRFRIIDWQKNVSEIYNTADILVCSSRIEPLGNIILEGWAHKIPVIASDIMGPGKLIDNKINGLKFSLGDSEQLLGCLKKISEDEELRNKIVKNGYTEYLNNFSKEKVMKKFLNFFNIIKK